MKKNCKIHLWLESELKELVEREARKEGISICEFCRRKLKEDSKLIRIEMMLEKILSSTYILENRKLYKVAQLKNSNAG